MKIAIIGGGIGGMCTALALAYHGLAATIYEQASELKEVGAGLRVTPNAARILKVLGAGDSLLKAGFKTRGLVYRRWQNGLLLAEHPLGTSMEERFGAPYLHIHRADLHQMLIDRVPAAWIKLQKKCVDVDLDSAQPTLTFANGETAEADIVIAADGINSVVRRQIIGQEQRRFSGDMAFRGLVPTSRLPGWLEEALQNIWVGPDRHFVQSLAGPGYINYVAMVPGDAGKESWSRRGDLGQLKREFAGWDVRIHELLDHTDTVMCWPLYDREPVDRWVAGHVALLGDAAHPMLPYLGQGAAQAIEDAILIARCIADVDEDHMSDALAVYEHMRQVRTSEIQLGARTEGNIYHLHDGEAQRRRDAAFQEITGANPARDQWLFGYDVLNDYESRRQAIALHVEDFRQATHFR